MATLLNANLPSEDEEDEDFVVPETAGQKRESKQKRGEFGGRRGLEGIPQVADDDEELAPRRKAARVTSAWEQLNARTNVAKLPTITPRVAAAGYRRHLQPRKNFDPDANWKRALGLHVPTSRATNSNSQPPRTKPHTAHSNLDRLMAAAKGRLSGPKPGPSKAQHGDQEATDARAEGDKGPDQPAAVGYAEPLSNPAQVTPTDSKHTPQGVGGDTEGSQPDVAANNVGANGAGSEGVSGYLALAAAALQATKDAASGSGAKSSLRPLQGTEPGEPGKAGQAGGSVGVGKMGGDAGAGLDAALESLGPRKKASVMDKSRGDWTAFKSADQSVAAELDGYMRSNDQYLEKKDFLQRTQRREYELERDRRLGADIRTRGRL